MAGAILGKPFTFFVLFVDSLNHPMVPEDPKITVFMFSNAGARQVLIDAQSMIPAVPEEVGRYTYTYMVESPLDVGDILYAEMTGQDPDGFVMMTEQEVTVGSSSAMGSAGITARFTKTR